MAKELVHDSDPLPSELYVICAGLMQVEVCSRLYASEQAGLSRRMVAFDRLLGQTLYKDVVEGVSPLGIPAPCCRVPPPCAVTRSRVRRRAIPTPQAIRTCEYSVCVLSCLSAIAVVGRTMPLGMTLLSFAREILRK